MAYKKKTKRKTRKSSSVLRNTARSKQPYKLSCESAGGWSNSYFKVLMSMKSQFRKVRKRGYKCQMYKLNTRLKSYRLIK
jgi:hypothetical protein